jgi:hypothetical protein
MGDELKPNSRCNGLALLSGPPKSWAVATVLAVVATPQPTVADIISPATIRGFILLVSIFAGTDDPSMSPIS